MKTVFTVFLTLGLVITTITAQEVKQESPKIEKKCCKKKSEKECSSNKKECSKQTPKSCCKIGKNT